MATLHISYFGEVADHCASASLSSEDVTTSTTSAVSAANPSGAKVAMFFSTADHWVAHGTGTPVATATSGFFLPANIPFWYRFNKSVSTATKFAAITLA